MLFFFVWLKPASLRASSLRYETSCSSSAVLIDDLCHLSDSEPIWVQDEDLHLQLGLDVIAHTGVAFHCSWKTTENAICLLFTFRALSDGIGFLRARV